MNALPCPAGQVCDPAQCQKNPCEGGTEQGHAGHHMLASGVPPTTAFNSTNLHLQAFDPMMTPRSLELGKADEWIVKSSLIAGHPFHIHVNPFEVIDEKTGERYWKDTLLIKPGRTVRLRTRYETFDGD